MWIRFLGGGSCGCGGGLVVRGRREAGDVEILLAWVVVVVVVVVVGLSL